MTVLGQLLIKSGLVTSRQVEAALRRQEQLGGRLGTCLLELGAITERQLDAALAKQLGLPAAQVEDLRDIPEEIHSLLPANLAISCEAVPFRVRDDQVDIAILEIKNRGLHDELAFVIGKWIHVHIANEVRIFEALRRYYGKDCTLRYRTLLERLDRDQAAAEASGGEGEEIWNRPFPDLEADEEEEGSAAGGGRGPKLVYPPAPVTRRSIELTTEERDALKRGAEATPEEPEAIASARVEPPPPEPAPAEPAPEPVGGATVEQHPSAPWPADNVQQIGELLLEKMAGHFTRVALFRVQRDSVAGWVGSGAGLDPNRLLGFRAHLEQGSVFSSLIGGGHLFVGRLASTPAHDELLQAVGGDAGTECLLSVVSVEDRPVVIAFGDRGTEGLDLLDFGAVHRLTSRAGDAMRDLILRKKRKQA